MDPRITLNKRSGIQGLISGYFCPQFLSLGLRPFTPERVIVAMKGREFFLINLSNLALFWTTNLPFSEWLPPLYLTINSPKRLFMISSN